MSAVWVGFPMIMTSAVFSGIIVYNLGFVTGIIAILVGDAVLMGYVGMLSYLAGASGKNFALTAADTFGAKGFRIVSAFLSTLVIGWFAFQTGMVGSTLNVSMGWSAAWITLLAGVLFVALTFVGIRAISWIGVVASALFIPLGRGGGRDRRRRQRLRLGVLLRRRRGRRARSASASPSR